MERHVPLSVQFWRVVGAEMMHLPITGIVSGGVSGPPTGIAAIQTVTGSTTGTSLTLTFGSLTDAAQCVPFVSAYISAGAFNFEDSNEVTWTADVFDDAGTVKCTLTVAADGNGATWSFSVTLVQFIDDYIVAKYSGTATSDVTNGDHDVTITSVDPDHAFVIGTARLAFAGDTGGDTNRAFRITSSTNVRVYADYVNRTDSNYIFYVVSDPDENMLVEHVHSSEAAGTWTNKDVTVGTDPRVNLVVASSVINPNGGFYPERSSLSCEALNATTVRFTRPNGYTQAGSRTSNFVVQVVTIPGATVQTGVHAWASADVSEVKTVTSVDTAKAAAVSLVPGNLVNSQDNVGFDNVAMAYLYTRIQLTAATQVTLTRGPTSGVDAGRVGYQVLSF